MSNPAERLPVRHGGRLKPWTRALQRHIEQNPDALKRIAQKVVQMAEEGDLEAIKEIGNRLDGKAIQATELSVLGGHESFKSMTTDQIMQAIRERLAADKVVAERLGVQLPALEGESTVVEG